MRFGLPKGTHEPFSIHCPCHRPRTRGQSHGHGAVGVSGNRRSTLLERKGRNQRRQPDLYQGWFTVSLGRFGRVGPRHPGRENDEGQLLEIVLQVIARSGVGPRSTNERTVLRKSTVSPGSLLEPPKEASTPVRNRRWRNTATSEALNSSITASTEQSVVRAWGSPRRQSKRRYRGRCG